MRTNIEIDSEDIFRRRCQEKEAHREELFSIKNAGSEQTEAYIHQQVVLTPAKISIGKPSFKPKF